eukprot:gene4819-1799_t
MTTLAEAAPAAAGGDVVARLAAPPPQQSVPKTFFELFPAEASRAFDDPDYLCEVLSTAPQQSVHNVQTTFLEAFIAGQDGVRVQAPDTLTSIIGTKRTPSMLLELWTGLILKSKQNFHPITVNRLRDYTESHEWSGAFRFAYAHWVANTPIPPTQTERVYQWMWLVASTIIAQVMTQGEERCRDRNHPGTYYPSKRMDIGEFGVKFSRKPESVVTQAVQAFLPRLRGRRRRANALGATPTEDEREPAPGLALR